MLEKRFIAVSPQAFTADGNSKGELKVFNSTLFKVKQEVLLNASAQPTAELEVKRIPDINTIIVGPRSSRITETIDISNYTVSGGANISAPEQKRPSIPEEEISRAVYEEEPAVALRVLPVDQLGGPVNEDNPIPVKEGEDWDELDITRDGDDDIIKAEFFKVGDLVETFDLEYNGEKSVIKVLKS